MSEENKNEIKKETKVKNTKKINIKGILIGIGVIILVAVIIVLVARNSNKRVIKTATNEIDMNNTENVEIIDGKKVNNSEEIKMKKNVEDLTCKITELSATSSKAKVVMEVTNNSNEEFAGKEVTIVFYEKEGRVYGQLKSYIGKIGAGEKIQVEVTTTLDVTNAYDYTVEINDANI